MAAHLVLIRGLLLLSHPGQEILLPADTAATLYQQENHTNDLIDN